MELLQDTIMWRGRLPWDQGLCGPQDAKWGRWFMGGDYVGLMYSLPEMIVSPAPVELSHPQTSGGSDANV